MKSKKRSIVLRFLAGIEKIGNMLPPPMMIFAFLSLLIIVISGIGTLLGWSATGQIYNTTSKVIEEQTIQVVNLMSVKGLQYMLTNVIPNLLAYKSLGLMLTIMFGIGIAEHSGWLNGLIRKAVEITPYKIVTPMVVFIGVMSNIAENAGYVLFVPLAAMIFKASKKHPIAGIAAGFAGVSGGFAANLLLSSNDAVISGFSDMAAKIIDPNYNVSASSNYFFMSASVVLLVLVGTFITEKIVIPMLGEYDEGHGDGTLAVENPNLSEVERKALRIANIVFVTILGFILLSCIPKNSWLRNPETGSLINGSILLEGIVPLFTILFFVPGYVYGKMTKKYTNSKELFQGFSSSIKTLSGFICVAFMASQFIKYFNYTNIGRILSIHGAHTLQKMNIGPIPLMILFILVAGFMNLFMASASAKYAIFAPVFVPMFMTLGIAPELTQVAYRIGDSSTNIIAPVLSSLPIILQAMKRYEKDSGFGTLVSCMLPYSVAFLVSWTIMLVVWILFKIPLGPGANLFI